jgi:hypothetical protein
VRAADNEREREREVDLLSSLAAEKRALIRVIETLKVAIVEEE